MKSSDPTRNTFGFTLTELMIGVAILGVMASIAVPNLLSYLPQYYLNGASRYLTTDLNYARMRATASNVEYCLNFNVGSESYEIQRGDKSVGTGDDDWTTEGVARNFADPNNNSYHKGIDIVSVTTNRIVFRPTGTASGSTITLRNTKEKTVTITVSLAGRIKAQ